MWMRAENILNLMNTSIKFVLQFYKKLISSPLFQFCQSANCFCNIPFAFDKTLWKIWHTARIFRHKYIQISRHLQVLIWENCGILVNRSINLFCGKPTTPEYLLGFRLAQIIMFLEISSYSSVFMMETIDLKLTTFLKIAFWRAKYKIYYRCM